jgi:hypothetical protein
MTHKKLILTDSFSLFLEHLISNRLNRHFVPSLSNHRSGTNKRLENREENLVRNRESLRKTARNTVVNPQKSY